MAYPSDYLGFYHDQPATTDTVVAALLAVRRSQLLTIMAAAYGGATPELYWIPSSGGNREWETRVYYGLSGFDHTYAEGDANEAFDRITMSDGKTTFAWNFKWDRTGAGTRLQLIDSYWYHDAGTGRGYEYLGHMDVVMSGENMSEINWDAAADPHDAPGLDED